MKYRPLPGTELELSVLGLGSYGLAGVYGPPDAGAFTSLVHRAYDLGITFFDTAAGYGQAETVLGRAVAPFRKHVTVCTKVGPGKTGTLSAQHLGTSCEESLRRLHTDYVDLYLLHYDAPSTPAGEIIAALESLKQAGKIRYYGVGHLPGDRITELVQRGCVSAVLMELHPAAWDQHAQVVPRIGNTGIIGFSVTGRGLFTGRCRPDVQFGPGDIRRLDPLFQREQLASGLRIAGFLENLGRLLDMTQAELSTAWALTRAGVASVLTGTSSTRHLEENARGAVRPFPPDLLEEFDAFLEAERKQVRAERRENLRSLLSGQLAQDPETARRDLVYLMEGMVSEGWASEGQVRELFFAMQRAQDRVALTGIQRDLRAMAPKTHA
ncbi:MAG: aldo/keto reductase [Bacillota bacterium]